MWVMKFSASSMRLGEVDEGDLGLDHPELGEVTPGLGFFGAKRRAEAVDLAQRKGHRLGVELAGLGQVGLAVEVVHLEELACAFAGGGGEDGRIGAGEAVECRSTRRRRA